jgi:hypothetical protein
MAQWRIGLPFSCADSVCHQKIRLKKAPRKARVDAEFHFCGKFMTARLDAIGSPYCPTRDVAEFILEHSVVVRGAHPRQHHRPLEIASGFT